MLLFDPRRTGVREAYFAAVASSVLRDAAGDIIAVNWYSPEFMKFVADHVECSYKEHYLTQVGLVRSLMLEKGVLVAANRRSRIEKNVVWYGGLRLSPMVGHSEGDLGRVGKLLGECVAEVLG